MEGFCPGGSFLHVILRLHFEEHLPQVVIGRRLGVTKSTVCSMFVRFRSICRTYRKYRYARSPRGKKRPRRPNFPYEFKIALVEQSLQPRTCVAQIARENGINDNLLFNCV
ncbi:transposase, partial [Escherichia coli]